VTMTDRAAALAEALGPDVAVVAVALRKAARQARLDHRPLGARLEQLIDDVESAERVWRRSPAGQSGPSMDAPSMPRARLERLGVGEVARLAGVTERSVRRAAATGRLAGRLGPTGAWWFHPDDVMRWQANRRGRSA
jgi:hypothetical protein